ncbi:MAG: hypothetical protein GF334_01335 [Candidatus Altiarchaeales archaeon]|nr:hypothetical protein [Candidatus Altiarchaeales archaeon]
MSKVDPSLYASLHRHIQSWIDENCEESNWPPIYIGHDTVHHMADASFSVFKAILEAEGYCKSEGIFSEE